MIQPDLFTIATLEPLPTKQEQFERFHRENPDVYALLLRFALQAKRSGRERFSIWAVYQRARWYTQIETRGDWFKLNNNWTGYYARKLMDEEPELDGFFETRCLKEEQ